jgi:hypothetical protein
MKVEEIIQKPVATLEALSRRIPFQVKASLNGRYVFIVEGAGKWLHAPKALSGCFNFRCF